MAAKLNSRNCPPRSYDIVSLGEAMVEFNQTENGDFAMGVGGDSCNFAVAAARQGARVAYVSAVGDDELGRMLRSLWMREGVDQHAVLTDAQGYTAAYIVFQDDHEHRFCFLRKGSAASRLQIENLPKTMLMDTRLLHLTGVSLALSDSTRAAVLEAVELVRTAGAQVSLDTNLRLNLWPLDLARNTILAAMKRCTLCLPSYEDVTLLTGLQSPDQLADFCLNQGPTVVALKLGAEGALIATPTERFRVPPWPCCPLDTTGAGDIFGGTFAARLLAGDDMRAAAQTAAVAAALSTERRGAVASIPRAAEVAAARASISAHESITNEPSAAIKDAS